MGDFTEIVQDTMKMLSSSNHDRLQVFSKQRIMISVENRLICPSARRWKTIVTKYKPFRGRDHVSQH